MDFREVAKFCSLVTICITVFIVGIILAANASDGPPPSCGKSGLSQVITKAKDDYGDTHPLVVCNNGTSFWP